MDGLLETTVYKTVGVNPRYVQELLLKAQEIDEKQIKYKHYSRYGEDIIRLIYDRNIEQRILLGVMQIFALGLEENLYAVDERTLPQQIVALLKEKGKRIAFSISSKRTTEYGLRLTFSLS